MKAPSVQVVCHRQETRDTTGGSHSSGSVTAEHRRQKLDAKPAALPLTGPQFSE